MIYKKHNEIYHVPGMLPKFLCASLEKLETLLAVINLDIIKLFSYPSDITPEAFQ